MSTKFAKLRILFALLVVCAALATGCGGGSSSSNVVVVTVTPPATAVLVTQTVQISALVTGTTNTNVTWTCTYITRSFDSASKETDGKATACDDKTGNIPANSTNTTVVFSAPQSVPDFTKLTGTTCTSSSAACVLAISVVATSVADTKKTGTAAISLGSGINVTLTPLTATVPTSTSTGQSQFQFNATLTNDIQNKGVTWLLTQKTPSGSLTYPDLATCSPGCGSVDQNGLYTAPTTVPTTATLTIVATSVADAHCASTGTSSACFAIGTITVVAGSTVTFNGISPTVAPQNATFYDIYLDAPNVTSASTVTVTADGGGSKLYNFASGQLKVLFPIPTSTVTTPASTGVRLRLLESDLASADTFTVSVGDPAQQVNVGSGPFRFSVVPVRATSVATLPDSVVQSPQITNEQAMTVNGGYFGPNTNNTTTIASFRGQSLARDSTRSSNSRQLALSFDTNVANNSAPGLYPFLVSNIGSKAPDSSTSVTNLAVFPDYSVHPPYLNSSISTGAGAQALTNASAIDIDTHLGVAAVAITGANRIDFFKIGRTNSATASVLSLTPLACPVASCSVNAPSGLSINQTQHTVAVVSFQDQSVTVLPIPTATNSPFIPAGPISLVGFVPPDQTPIPLAYSIGVDSDTNMALVAYSSAANPTTAKVGFLLDLNNDSQSCLTNPAQTVSVPPCVFAQVTLNTGQLPQIAMLPHTHLAVVTPGGLGVPSGVDVTKASTSQPITNASLTSGLVTITTKGPHGLNPGNPGTVLILNLPKGQTNQVDFNGAFTVQSIINSNSFTYALNSTVNDSTPCDPAGSPPCNGTANYSAANITIGGISQTSQGVAVNPITGLVAMADANATGQNGPQINLVSSLDQNISSISFRANCTLNTTTCAGAPELLGTTAVAFQPFTNALVSYNSGQSQVSVSNPVTLARAALVCNSATPCDQKDNVSTGAITLPGAGTATLCFKPNSATNPFPLIPDACSDTAATAILKLTGAVAVDGPTNQAIIVQSGSSTIQLIDLGVAGTNTFMKPVQVTEVLVPSVAPSDPHTLGGIKGASFPQGTLTSTIDLAGVKIFGSGFGSGAVVRLDGTAISTPSPVTDREIDVTIPASFLAAPHRYALDVVSGGVESNASDFIVVTAVDFSQVCKDSSNNFINTKPSSVAVADQLKLSGYAPIAVVSNSGCNSVSKVDIAPQLPTFNGAGHLTGFAPNPNFGKILGTITVGSGPQGVAISPRFGLAVVANNGGNSASIVDLLANNLKVADVATGTGPIGVAINEGTGAALVANTGANTVSEINLGLLFPPTGTTAPTTLTATTIGVDTSPIAIAVDPDRGTNNNGLAVVTALALSSTFPRGVLDSVDIGAATPAKSITAAVGSVTLTPTGVVFDPSVSPALFYAVSSGGNVVSAFNPDNGFAATVHVGINPTSLAINPQTGGIMTVNSISNTISIVDTLSSPFKTRRSYGIPGSPQFGVAIDQFLNMAVIVDQANNRVFLFPLPN